MPKRIQRRRTKGWKMPPDTIYVGRPTRWGNPFTFEKDGPDALKKFRNHIENITDSFEGLRGKDLACWCKEGAPCHADILLELANTLAIAGFKLVIPVLQSAMNAQSQHTQVGPGICYAHGLYGELGCPKAPLCATDPQKPEYVRMCLSCGEQQDDNGFIAWCPRGHVYRLTERDPRYEAV